MHGLCATRALVVPGAASCSSGQLPRGQLAPVQHQRQAAGAAYIAGSRRGLLQVLSAKKADDKAAEKPKAKGFGPAKPAVSGTKAAKGAADSSTAANSGVAAPGGGYWTDVKINIQELKERPADKPGKAVILANSKAICLFLYKDKVYCTAGNGTAYEYPLFDSELFDAADGKPAIRCKFDQTSYYLDTGVVIEWCPKEDSPLSVRNMLSTLKKVTNPVNLKVYPTRVQKDGNIEILYSM